MLKIWRERRKSLLASFCAEHRPEDLAGRPEGPGGKVLGPAIFPTPFSRFRGGARRKTGQKSIFMEGGGRL